jgi:DNA-binding NarL/FixJ family response regulator
MIQFSKRARLEAKTPCGSTPAESAARARGIQSGTNETSDASRPVHGAIVLIEPRTLIRDCLAKCLETAGCGETIHGFASASDWVAARMQRPITLLILLGTADHDVATIAREVAVLAEADPSASIVLLADDVDSEHVLGALDRGARGYIPTSMPFDVAVKAIHLVRAGGTFVPVESLRAPKALPSHEASDAMTVPKGQFTTRQIAVIEALRRGKANKVIAFELNMRESTVKVHVRNIMKKLQAKNRTEVAFLVSAMSAGDKGLEGARRAIFTKSLP